MLDDYRIFARIIEAGSFSAAARHLRVSTSHVSKRLAALEQRLGVRLLDRSTRRMLVTAPGERFYAEVAAILARSQHAEDAIAGRSATPAGRLRITTALLVGRLHISPLIPAFLKRYPDINFEIDLDDGFVDLRRSQYDLAIRVSAKVENSGLETRTFASFRRILCCAPDYLAKAPPLRHVEDLSRHKLLGSQTQFPWSIEGPSGFHVIHGESLVRTNASEVVKDLVLGGLGVALRSPLDVAEALSSGEIVRVLPDYRGAEDVEVYAVYRNDIYLSPAAEAFIAHIEPAWSSLRTSAAVTAN